MKHLLSFLLSFTPLLAMAYDFEVEGIYYDIISTIDKTVEITNPKVRKRDDGSAEFVGTSPYSGDIVIPSSVFFDGVNYSVSCIDTYCFSGGKDLLSVRIPSSVTIIEKGAFKNCTNLTAIEIPNSVIEIGSDAFSGCSKIESVKIPNSIISIGDYAFEDCTSLNDINIPGSVASVGDDAFSGCKNLPIYNNARYADKYLIGVIDKSITSFSFKKGVRFINRGAFRNCNQLKSLNIPDGVISIGKYAFYGCKVLETIDIPNSVTSIEDYVFYECSELTSISIGNKVRSIGEWAFYDCQKLKTINLDSAPLLIIEESAFSDCQALTEITLPQTLQEIGEFAFRSTGLKGVVIPNSVVSLGQYSFYGNRSLQSATIGNSITHLPKKVFESTGLRNITFADNSSLKVIGEEAFSGCGFSNIELPNTVDSLMSGCFYGCSHLKNINLPQNISYIADNAFDGCAFNEPLYTNKQFIFMPRNFVGTYSIPEGIENIVGHSFDGCSYLTMVEIPSSVKRIGESALGVPSSTIDIYAGKDV